MLRPFINLLIPLFVALSMGLRPVVKMFNMILRPVYKAMMTAMRDAGGGMAGMGAAVGAGLEELGKLWLIMLGEFYKVLLHGLTDLIVYAMEVIVILMGGISGFQGAAVQAVGALETLRIIMRAGITAGITDLVKSFSSFSDDTEDVESDISNNLSGIQSALVSLAGVFSEDFAAGIQVVYEIANKLDQVFQDIVTEGGMSAFNDIMYNMLMIAPDAASSLETLFLAIKKFKDEKALETATEKTKWWDKDIAQELSDSFLNQAGGSREGWGGEESTGWGEDIAKNIEDLDGKTSDLNLNFGELIQSASGLLFPITKTAEALSIDLYNSLNDTTITTQDTANAINTIFSDLKTEWEGQIKTAENILSNLKKQSRDRDTEGKAVGGVISKTDNYLLHKGEYVVPSGHARGKTENYNPTINIKGVVVNKDMDIRDLASKLERYMKQERRRSSSYA